MKGTKRQGDETTSYPVEEKKRSAMFEFHMSHYLGTVSIFRLLGFGLGKGLGLRLGLGLE